MPPFLHGLGKHGVCLQILLPWKPVTVVVLLVTACKMACSGVYDQFQVTTWKVLKVLLRFQFCL